MRKITGRFYFERTESGNLLGEYSHDNSKKPYPECACPTEAGGDALLQESGFPGHYISVWVEEYDKTVEAKLEIIPKRDCVNIFTLKWAVRGEQVFRGEAMLCGGRLIGDYQSA